MNGRRVLSLLVIIIIMASAQGCNKISIIQVDNESELFGNQDTTHRIGVPILIENDHVHNYINDVHYSSFSYSKITEYAIECGYRMDYPSGYIFNPFSYVNGKECCVVSAKNIDNPKDSYIKRVNTRGELCISNLTPNCDYLVEVYDSDDNLLIHRDTISAYGQVRMLFSGNAWNLRDIGGLHCHDGRTIKYGKIFRGGAYPNVTDDDISLVRDLLCIKTEIDLRSREELLLDDADKTNNRDYSVFGDYVDYYHCPLPLSYYLFESDTFARIFMVTLESLRNNGSVFIHCAGGADRTGAVFMLFEAVLCVLDSDIAKDYELTSFAPLYYDKDNYRYCNRCQDVFSVFAAGEKGITNQIIAQNFLKRLGVTEIDINEFKNIVKL